MMKEWDQFFPNACYVCQIYGSKANLSLCNGCRMISYCSKTHQLFHWPWHRQICNHLQFLREKTNLMKFEKCTPKTRVDMQVKLLKEAHARIIRPLKSYETEMLIYRKECLVCFKQSAPGIPLYRCRGCASVSFCIEHKKNTEHNKYCDKYKLAFLASISASIAKDNKERSICYMLNVSFATLPHDMTSFLQMYLIPFYEKESRKEEILTLEAPWLLYHSQDISGPLTVLFAMKELNFNLNVPKLIIHVLANAELKYIDHTWEIFLHLAPVLESLRIVIIIPDMCQSKRLQQLCEKCIKRKKTLSCEYVMLSYSLYAKTSNYTKPDIIAVLNTDESILNNLYQDEANDILPSIEMLAKIDCPYIYTCCDEDELNNEMSRINFILKRKTKYLYCGKNNFASLQPIIHPLKRKIFYINEFIIIYEKY